MPAGIWPAVKISKSKDPMSMIRPGPPGASAFAVCRAVKELPEPTSYSGCRKLAPVPRGFGPVTGLNCSALTSTVDGTM